MSGFRSTRRALRATIVALAVLVLVPAWMARVTYLYACPGDGQVSKTRCCKAAADQQAEPVAKRACCEIDEVDLGAPRPPSAPQDTAAIAPPDAVAIAAVAFPPLALSEAAKRPSRRATGPPTYLRKLALLR
jgi:hypothetical protein